MKNEVRELLTCVYVGADRNLTYQLSYASKYTLLAKLMRRFHEALVGDDTRKQKLKDIFGEALQQFADVREFNEFRATLAEMTERLGQGLPYRLDIDFSAYDPSNFFHSLRVYPHYLGEVRTFEELGSGQAEILALAFAYAYAKAFGQRSSLILVVDEPESHLHPLAQQWLASKLDELVTDGLQIVITTHSPSFVDLSHPENLVVVRRPGNDASTTTRQMSRAGLVDALKDRGALADRTTEASVGEFYVASATNEIRAGLFARSAVLVEGSTESYALPELLRLVGFDPLHYGIAFVSVEGISNIAKWHRLYAILGIPVYVIFDTDSNKTGSEASAARAARIDIMTALGQDSALADQMSSDALAVQESFTTLAPDFEGAMNALLGERWLELKTQAQSIVGGSKPLVARYVAQRLQFADLEGEAQQGLLELAYRLIEMTPGADGTDLDSGSLDDEPEVYDDEPEMYDVDPPF